MDSGIFKVLQIVYDVENNELFRFSGSAQLSVAWMRGERIIAASIGLNVNVAF